MTGTVKTEIFKAERRKSAVDSVIEIIRDLLITRQLKKGDRLPNETVLTEKLSLSRGSIREAMKILSSFGVVEIRRGDGTYIAHSAGSRLFDHIVFQLMLSEADEKKLMEFRELIERGIIRIVIAHARDEDVAAIRREYARMVERVEAGEPDSAVLTELDLRFHRAIGRATGNEFIERVYEFTLDFFSPWIKRTNEMPDRGRESLKHHENILMGLESRDQKRAELAVEASVRHWVIAPS